MPIQTNRLLATAVISICLLLSPNPVAGTEAYCIDGSPVLLYKIINWWYDCPPEDSHRFCGSRISCTGQGDVRVTWDRTTRTLRLAPAVGFADLLAAAPPGRAGTRAAAWTCTFINRKYFGDARTAALTGTDAFAGPLVFCPVTARAARNLQMIADDLQLVVEGTITGLQNGRIALHRCGGRLRACPETPAGSFSSPPISLTITNARTHEFLARYALSGIARTAAADFKFNCPANP